MLAVNYTAMRNNLKDYCDLVSNQGETIIVTRKSNKNVVVISLEQYNAMEKELKNIKYLEKFEHGFKQLYSGKRQVHGPDED